MMKVRLLVALLALGWVCSTSMAQSLDQEFRAVNSRILSMAEGYYTAAEWSDAMQQLEEVAQAAADQGQVELLINTRLLRAMVHADMRKEYEQARAVLEAAKRQYGDSGAPNVKRVYGRLAEVYAKLGDQDAIDALIKEYQGSSAYDAVYYNATFAPGGPHSQITIQRPRSGPADSITLTSMQRYKDSSRLRTGSAFPPFDGQDAGGNTIRLSDYLGKVVLVDFWVSGWHPWLQSLRYQVQTYNRYRERGFDIVGVSMDSDVATALQTMSQQGMTWNNIVGFPSLAHQYGIYGEATNFLLDREGRILARNVSGSTLVEAVKGAL